MIRVLYDLDESVNPIALNNEISMLGLKGSTDVDKIYNAILKMANPKAKKISDDILKVYGSSKKELIAAIEAVLAYNEAREKNDQTAAAKAIEPFMRMKDGKLNDSKVLKMAKELIEALTDNEFEQVVQAFEEDKNGSVFRKAPYKVLQDRPKKLFRISDQEEERFYKSKSSSLKGLIDKTGTKRNVKKKVNKAVGAVTGAVSKAAGAVKDKFGKAVNAGKYLAGWLT